MTPWPKPHRRMLWRKVRQAFWDGESALLLSGVALALRVMIEVRALPDSRQRIGGKEAPGIGWVLREDGLPLSPRALAIRCHFTEAQIATALAELLAGGLLVRSDDGVWGTPGWADRQAEANAINGNEHENAFKTAEYRRRRGTFRGSETWVYFIQAGEGGPIKIGMSNAPLMRLAELQTAIPQELTLLGRRSGGKAEETELHARLAAHRIRGEWFAPHANVLAVVREEIDRG